MSAYADTLVRLAPAAPADIFGHLSQLAPPMAPTVGQTLGPTAGGPLLSGTLTFRIGALVLLVCYCMALLLYRSNARTLIKTMGNRLYTEKLLSEQNFLFKRFLAFMSIIGAIAWPMIVIRLAEVAGARLPGSGTPAWMAELALPAMALLMLLFFLWRRTVLSLSGWFSLSSGFVSGLLQLTRMVFVLITMLTTPVLLLLALDHGHLSASILAWVVAAGIVLGLWLLLYKTFTLFVGQKVSILYWFLYLCTVEIFPLSLIALLAARKGGFVVC